MAEVGALRVTLGLDSIDFTKGLTDVNRKLRALDGEFKAITSGAGKFDNTLEKLKAQSDVLNRSLEVHGAKVAELKRKYDDSARVKGEDARETQLLLIQYNKAVTAMTKVENQLKQTEQRIETQSSAWKKLGQALEHTHGGLSQIGMNLQMTGMNLAMSFGTATASIAAGLGLASKKAIDFEAQMSSVKSVMSVDEAKRFGDALEDLAITLGEDTRYSSIQAAQGIEELLRAGVKVEDIINGGLKSSLDLATAGELGLAQAAQIASTALNAFNKDGLTAERAANLLAGAANASATTVSEMEQGLSQVAAVASGMGLTFQDTSTALASFAMNGLRGSDAGTSLKTMLNNLIPKTESAYEAMMDLGIVTKDGANSFFDAEGNIKSMADISEILKTSMQGLTAEQRQLSLYTMFGSDAIRAANILYEEGAEGINKMYSEMSKVTAADVAATKMDNLKGKIEELRGAFDTALISLGTALMPLITKLVAGLQQLVNWFNNLSPTMQTLIAISGVVTAGLLGIVTAIGLVLTLVGGAITGFGLLSTSLTAVTGGTGLFATAVAAITGPIGIAVTAIGGLIAVLILVYQKNEEFRNKVNEIWKNIQEYFAVAMSFINNLVRTVMTEVMNFFGEILATIQGFWKENGDRIMVIVTSTFQDIYTTIQLVMGLIQGVFQVVWPIISGIVQIAWGLIKTSIKNTLDIILSIIEVAMNLLAGDWEGAWESIKDTAESIMNNIVDFFEDIDLWDIGQDIIQGLIDGIGSMKNAIIKKVNFLAGLIPKGVKDFLDINSPSRVMANEVGKWIPAGIADGMEKNIGTVINASKKIASVPVEGVNNVNIPQVNSMSTPSYGNVEIPLNVDGYELTRLIIPIIDLLQGNNFTSEARLSGVKIG